MLGPKVLYETSRKESAFVRALRLSNDNDLVVAYLRDGLVYTRSSQHRDAAWCRIAAGRPLGGTALMRRPCNQRLVSKGLWSLSPEPEPRNDDGQEGLPELLVTA
jgi:hypothetical protein